MTAEIVNLNKYRKEKARAEKKAKAAGNRARHGRRKGDKARDDLACDTRETTLDGKELTDDHSKDEPA